MRIKPILFSTSRLTKWQLLFLLFAVIHSVGAQVFTNSNTVSLPGLANAKAQWVDFNNDDQLDLFVAGITASGTHRTGIHIYTGNNTFNTIALPALTDISFDFGDYNKDGFIDVVVSGTNSELQPQTTIYRNIDGIGFVAQNFSLTPLSKGGVLWSDFDDDGDLDLVVSGLNSSSEQETIVYEFRDATYNIKTSSLPAVSNGEIKNIDVDSDGKFEILITGLEGGTAVSRFFSVNEKMEFTIVNDVLDGSAFNNLSISDLNADGFSDFVVAGFSGDALLASTTVYSNNGSLNFIETNTAIIDLSSGSLTTGDINSDGLPDILLTGQDDNGFNHVKFYRNEGAYSFTDVTTTLPVIYSGDAVLGDYDNDGDLDIFQIGNSDLAPQGNIFLSDQSETIQNDPPAAPTNLVSQTNFKNVTLTWNAPTDDQTSPGQLTYNLYISSDQYGGNLVVAPLSNLTTGFLRIPREGNHGVATSKELVNLPEGQYYWSVQAVDNGFRGSVFSTEQSFSICHPVSLGKDTTLCYNSAIEFERGGQDDVIRWTSISNGELASTAFLSYTVLNTDTVIVEVTRPFGCTVTDTVVVAMAPLPSVSLGADQQHCIGTQALVTVSTNADSVNWLRLDNSLRLANETEYAQIVQQQDTVVGQVFSSSYRCVSYDTILLKPLSLPEFTIGNDLEICYKDFASLEVQGSWAAVNWRALQSPFEKLNSSFAQFPVLQKDTVIAEVSDFNECVNYDTLVVNVLSLPIVNLGEDLSICYGETTVIEMPFVPYTLTWYNKNDQVVASHVNQYPHLVTIKDTITVEAVDVNGCVNTDSVTVDVLPLPVFDLGKDSSACFDKNILLVTGSGFQDVDWFSKRHNTIVSENIWFYNHAVIETDTLIAKVTSIQGCIQYDSIEIEMLPLPVFSLADDFSACFRTPVQLSVAGNWLTTNWFTDNEIALGAGQQLQFLMEQTLNVYCEVTHLNGCVNYDTVQVTSLPLPMFDLGLTPTYCAGDNVSVSTSHSGPTFHWTDGSVTTISNVSEYLFVAETSKMVRLQIINNQGCLNEDSVFIEVNALPTFQIVGDASLCVGEQTALTIDAPEFLSLVWMNNETSVVAVDETSLAIPLVQNDRIFAHIVDLNECTYLDSIDVEVYPLPPALAGADTLLCFGEQVRLGGNYEDTSSLTFAWTPVNFLDNPAGSEPLSTPAESVEYTVRVEDENGCVGSDTVFVEVNPQITIDAGQDAAICIGESIALGGSPTASGSRFSYHYDWSSDKFGFASEISNPIVQPQETTRYYIFVSTGRCEVFLDSVSVAVNPSPTVEVTQAQSIGAGGSILLAASGADYYTWTPTETLDDPGSKTPLASPLVTTTYTVAGADVNGCKDTAQLTVFVQNTIFIPSLFTPNGDGSNDSFKLFGSGIREISFSVFDQAGTLLYSTKSATEAVGFGWDGTHNGKIVKNDLYVWTIEGNYYNGEAIRYQGRSKGIFKLLR